MSTSTVIIIQNVTDKPLLAPPDSDSSHHYEQLAYLDAYDAPLNCDYAFLVYKETDTGSGEWRVRIRSSQTAGAVFEPAMIRAKAREVFSRGETWFPWGYSFDPEPADPRLISFRVHVADGKPAAIQVLVRLRRGDGGPGDEVSVTVPWPAA